MSQINETRDAGIMTYPEMDGKIVDLLRFHGDPTSRYSALRIEELEAEVEQLLERAQRAEAEAEHLREALRDIRAALKPPQQVESEAIIRGIDGDLAERDPRQVYSENDMNVLRATLAGCRDSNASLKKRAETAAWEAAAREDTLVWALETVWDQREELYSDESGSLGWSIELDVHEGNIVRDTLQDRDMTANALLELTVEERVEAKTADLHGLLQGVRTSLERASDLLASPAEVGQAQDFIEGALEAMIEELD